MLVNVRTVMSSYTEHCDLMSESSFQSRLLDPENKLSWDNNYNSIVYPVWPGTLTSDLVLDLLPYNKSAIAFKFLLCQKSDSLHTMYTQLLELYPSLISTLCYADPEVVCWPHLSIEMNNIHVNASKSSFVVGNHWRVFLTIFIVDNTCYHLLF